MRTNDIRAFFRTGESVKGDEFGDWFGCAVENTEDGDARVCHADISRDFEEDGVVVGVVSLCCFAYRVWTQDHRIASWCLSRHLVDEIDVVLAGHIGDVDWSAGYATGGGMESGVVVACLKHVPVWEDVEILRDDGVVRVAKYVPGVAGRDFREEVVRVTEQHAWFVGGELRVED